MKEGVTLVTSVVGVGFSLCALFKVSHELANRRQTSEGTVNVLLGPNSVGSSLHSPCLMNGNVRFPCSNKNSCPFFQRLRGAGLCIKPSVQKKNEVLR